jgi:hypothetical protein
MLRLFLCCLRLVWSGDDPKTYDQVVEIQQVTCFATDGTFQLGFRMNNTRPTLWNVTAMGRTGSLQVLLLPLAVSCCILLHLAVSCCILLYRAASCCILLHLAASCCILLPLLVSCCIFLSLPVSSCLLLHLPVCSVRLYAGCTRGHVLRQGRQCDLHERGHHRMLCCGLCLTGHVHNGCVS